MITDPLTYLQKQSTEATIPIKECSQRKCAPCGCDGEWRSATLLRCRSASAHRHVEGQTSNGRIHTSPHGPCANRAKSRWAPSPSNGLPAINNPSFHHTADQTKFGALIHVHPACVLCSEPRTAATHLCFKFVQRRGSRWHTKEFFFSQSKRAALSVMVLWCLNRALIVNFEMTLRTLRGIRQPANLTSFNQMRSSSLWMKQFFRHYPFGSAWCVLLKWWKSSNSPVYLLSYCPSTRMACWQIIFTASPTCGELQSRLSPQYLSMKDSVSSYINK